MIADVVPHRIRWTCFIKGSREKITAQTVVCCFKIDLEKWEPIQRALDPPIPIPCPC